MRFLLALIISAWFLPGASHAYELMVVQAVSASKKSFVTRNGLRQGVVPDVKATFTANDVSVIARARTVTSGFTQWEIVNQEAVVPFKHGDLVTYHPAQEYLWALNPEESRRKAIIRARPPVRRSWLVKAGGTRGLNETVSEVAPQDTSRGGVALDALYEREFNRNFAWDAGVRYERETVNVTGGSLVTQRLMAVGDFLYYFDPMEEFHAARVFFAAGMGIGQSSTTIESVVQSGNALLLPSAKVGMSLPFNQAWEMLVETAFETLKTDEKLESGGRQTVNQSNLRVGLGLRKFF